MHFIALDEERTHSYSTTNWSRDCMEQSIDQRMNRSWDAYHASPADFAGADDIITNLAKEREPLIIKSFIILRIMYYSVNDRHNRKKNLSAPIRSRTQGLPITSLDALPLSFKRI